MCFSATASLTAGALLLGVGASTWRMARGPSDRLLAVVALSVVLVACGAYAAWLASVWCFFAAAPSAIVWLHFAARRRIPTPARPAARHAYARAAPQ